jgi:hypothetical protein
MNEGPPTFWDGVIVGVSVSCAVLAILLTIIGMLGGFGE